ncbi:MAG: transposase [Methylococcales bacterium]|jgi:transposase-like protein|nr:transposase [Methylococcales bacterium]MBT7443324.1 transposase [Methylococcales bacterium]
MVTGKRRAYSPELKAQVVLEALQESGNVSDLSNKHGIHATQIHQWKKVVLNGLPEIFRQNKKNSVSYDESLLIGQLFEQIGRLTVQLEQLKRF